MRVWIVNPYDNLPPEGFRPQRFWLMAEAFAAAGHDATYWTSDFSHALKRPRQILQDSQNPVKNRQNASPGHSVDSAKDSVNPVKSGSFALRLVHEPAYPKNICLRRVWAHWRWARNWRAAAEAEAAAGLAPDLIVVSSPPLLIGREVRAFCRRRNIPYVVDVMDAWPETFHRLAPAWLFAPMRRIAAANYRSATAISVVAERYLSLLRNGYGVTAPIQLFHHGIAMPGDLISQDSQNPVKNRQNASPDYSVDSAKDSVNPVKSGTQSQADLLVYVGNMSASYDLATVLEAFREMPDLRLAIAGSGPDEPRLRACAPPNVEFLGYLDEAALHRLLSSAAAALVPMFPESCVGVPYKLGDYAAHSLPVATCLDGETRRLVEDSGAGVYYPTRDAAALRTAVRRILQNLPAMRRAMASLAPRFDASRIYPAYVTWITGPDFTGFTKSCQN